MKYPKAKISKFSERDGYYVWLTISTYLSNNNKVFDFFNENGDNEEKVKQIIFATEELAQEALDKFNNPMNKTRNYPALKQEGIDNKYCPKGYIYVGYGDRDYPLSKDWFNSDLFIIHKDGTVQNSNWYGDSENKFCVQESVWNEKFPAAKKSITLDEIKSQYEEAKKLIGKRVKDIGSRSGRVVKVNLYIEEKDTGGERHLRYYRENGYVISMQTDCVSPNCFPYQDCKVIKDVKVVLNSSHIAIISPEGITVGCQKFPLDIIDKLVAAKKELA